MAAGEGEGERGREPRRTGGAALACMLLLAAALAGCASQPSTPVRAAASGTDTPEIVRSSVRFQKEYVLVAGDQLEVVVWRTPEVSRTVFVRPDGYISLPLLQEVKAAGLTPRELAEGITRALSGRLRNPEVTVIPMTVRQPSVYVLGDVRTPGAFPARNAVTVAQALALAGGALRTGSEAQATIIRLTEDGYLEAIPVGGGFTLSQSTPYHSLAVTMLRPDDIVFVPESGRSQVFRALTDILIPFQIYLNYKLIQTIVP